MENGTNKGPRGKSKKVKEVKCEFRAETELDHAHEIMRMKYHSTVQIAKHFGAEPSIKSWLNSYCGMDGGASHHWMGELFSSDRAIECATMGLMDNVPLIMAERARAEKLDVQVVFPSWQPDIVGAFPDVPSFLAGQPDCMRRLVNQVSDTRPVRIMVGMASSSAFGADVLAKRGALISALALQLSKTRSVEVWSINSGRKHFTKGDLNGRSYDWSVMVKLPHTLAASDLSYWLCHQASVRGLLYSVERAYTGNLNWPCSLGSFANYGTPEGIAAHAKLWGAGESDIVIPFPFANMGETEMMINPENWMRNALRRVNAVAESC
jgi:hypothetical protein